MQLSKKEFSSLSKKDQNKLMNGRSKRAVSAQQGNKKKGKPSTPRPRGPRQNGGRQASVAAAYSTPMTGKAPMIRATRDSCNIKHREFIGNITGSTAFTVQQFLSVNPGLSNVFPWLSVMAQAWEEYRFRNIRFVYKTRTGSTTIGSIIMAPDYDSSDAQPSSEQVLTTYSQAIEDAPWKDITCVLKTSNENPLGRRHFIRTGPLAANLDIKTYDIANFIVATVDATGAVPFGKLWVEYDVDFFIPQLPPSGALAVAGGRVQAGGALTSANPLGTVPAPDAQDLGFTVDALSNVTFQTPGTIIATWRHTGTALTAMTITPSLGAVAKASQATAITAAFVGSLAAGFSVVTGSVLAFAVTDAGAAISGSLFIGYCPTDSMA